MVQNVRINSKIGRWFISLVLGFLLLMVNWFYSNSQYTFGFEDSFFNKTFLWKFKVFKVKPRVIQNFIFINTSKDLALVEDTLDYGSVAITDREKLYEFIKYINEAPGKPAYTLMDIQFYYRNSPDLSIDTLLNNEVVINKNIVIPVLRDKNGQMIRPIINANYANSEYTSFGNGFTKFKLFGNGDMLTIPVFLHEKVNQAVYKNDSWFLKCNQHICLSSIWPSYFLKPSDIKENRCPYTQYYNLGELLLAFQSDTAMSLHFFDNKVVIMGNFDTDIHNTPVGKSPGSMILANIYLSLLNKQHFVSYLWLLVLWISLSILSYFASFSGLPKIKLKFSFIFSKHLVSFIQNYFSYMGYLLLLSLISIYVFNWQVDLLLPSVLLTFIEYFSHKKYKPEQ